MKATDATKLSNQTPDLRWLHSKIKEEAIRGNKCVRIEGRNSISKKQEAQLVLDGYEVEWMGNPWSEWSELWEYYIVSW